MGDSRNTGPGPCERAWRAHYAADDGARQCRARLVMAAGEPPLVVVPAWYGPEQREAAFAVAVMRRYERMFGYAALVAAVGLQHCIPAGLALVEGDEGVAAD